MWWLLLRNHHSWEFSLIVSSVVSSLSLFCLIFPYHITPILSKVYEKFVSHKLPNFCEKCGYLPAAQFAYMTDWAALADALFSISHHHQESLDAGMESCIVQLNFSTAFDGVSHSSLSSKFKSIGVGVSVLSVCREFLSSRRERVVVDGATSEWIPIVSCVPQGSWLDPLLFILYTSEMFELVDYICLYTDDSTLPEVVRKPVDRPAVAASRNRELAPANTLLLVQYCPNND